MSLQLLAKQMEAKGRGGDSLLVHMTPEEVAGLQKLAESAGGSLTVNPETGLVEANFLKRMLPTLVGLGVGAFAGPVAGAAAGAAVGGYQAKRNDQDVLLGAAMGGLGGYGGASLGAGLGAAGAAGAGAAGATAAPMTAAQGLSQAGQGIGALGSEAGRTAFMSKVGGGAGLLSDVSMAAAPLMAPGKKPGEAPVDDEMYYTEYNPGQTGERSSTSTEALQFAGGYTPIERIKDEDYIKRRNRQFFAAQGGLMSLAEGGETAAPAEAAAPAFLDASPAVIVYGPDGTMYGSPAQARAAGVTNPTYQPPVLEANRIIPRMPDSGATSTAPSSSEAALAYLMGERSSSAPARSPFIDAQLMGASPKSNFGVGADNMYAFDPATGTFLRNPNVAGATSSAVRGPVGTSFASSGGGDGYQPAPPNPDFDTPEKQAAFYADPKNAVFADITRAGQTALSYTPMSLFASAVAPEYMEQRALDAEAITRGISAPPSAGLGYFGRDYSLDNSVEMVGGGGGGDSGGYNNVSTDYMGFDPSQTEPGMGGWKQGGITSLAKGGMASGGFVVPADVVSALGNGSTDAGLRKLSAMTGNIKPIKGKGDGLSDSIPTNIDGKQPARVADGEAYIDPKTVKRLGGAKKLYAMMDKIRAQAHGKTTQQRKVNPARVMA